MCGIVHHKLYLITHARAELDGLTGGLLFLWHAYIEVLVYI